MASAPLQKRPLLVLAALFLTYFSLLSLGLYLFTLWQENSYLKQQSRLVANTLNQSPSPSSLTTPDDLVFHLINNQGLLEWKQGNSQSPFHQVNFETLRRFHSPSTIETTLNGRWLLHSKFMYAKGEPSGAIVIGKRIKSNDDLETTSAQLQETMANISSQLQLHNTIPTLPSQAIYPQIDGITVTDRFGTITFNQGFIPLSLIFPPITSLGLNTIHTIEINNRTHRLYSQPLTFNQKELILVATQPQPETGITLTPIFQISAITSLFFVMFITYLYAPLTPSTLTLTFNADTGTIKSSTHTLSLPHDTNQYYLLKLLVKKPNKWWETDELADGIFGDQSDPQKYQRAIYDAARLINQKAKQMFNNDLILINNKRYRLNQKVHSESR
jgi:hypothetical protein